MDMLWIWVDEGRNNLMECIMFVVFVIEILDSCVPYVVRGMRWIRVRDVAADADADGRTTFNVCLFVRTRPEN